MDRQSVSSSNIGAIGYDPGAMMLEIQFNNGALYQYDNVPAGVHADLMSAGSHGSYFSANIRNQYPTRLM